MWPRCLVLLHTGVFLCAFSRRWGIERNALPRLQHRISMKCIQASKKKGTKPTNMIIIHHWDGYRDITCVGSQLGDDMRRGSWCSWKLSEGSLRCNTLETRKAPVLKRAGRALRIPGNRPVLGHCGHHSARAPSFACCFLQISVLHQLTHFSPCSYHHGGQLKAIKSPQGEWKTPKSCHLFPKVGLQRKPKPVTERWCHNQQKACARRLRGNFPAMSRVIIR